MYIYVHLYNMCNKNTIHIMHVTSIIRIIMLNCTPASQTLMLIRTTFSSTRQICSDFHFHCFGLSSVFRTIVRYFMPRCGRGSCTYTRLRASALFISLLRFCLPSPVPFLVCTLKQEAEVVPGGGCFCLVCLYILFLVVPCVLP